MQILLATTNPGKLREIRAVMDSPQIHWLGLGDLDQTIDEPVEDQPTFEGNALLKARYYAQHAGLTTLADDSGLEVNALGGAPGVRSARYAEMDGPREVRDPANNRKLMAELAATPLEQRTARFVCAMALVPAGEAASRPPLTVRGTIEGRIILPDEAADSAAAHEGIGDNGFGYDPLFMVPRLGKTTAQLPPEEKNAISHRGSATRQMWQAIQQAGWLA